MAYFRFAEALSSWGFDNIRSCLACKVHILMQELRVDLKGV